uniref:HAT C-terminal dimerisation domain-containing protein n=1 Tax=Daphnia galeata TaxID=27404 RepID=A0A8J2VZZ2_9CRUS|nr:unnamed protein product [Daphnia galeata]
MDSSVTSELESNSEPNSSSSVTSLSTAYHITPVSPTSNTNVKRLLLPPEFFQFIEDVPGKPASYYKCTFPGCKPKKDKHGQDKHLVVYHETRGNGKRHFCDHDPNGEHKKKWADALKAMKEHSVQNLNSNRTPTLQKTIIITQQDLNVWVLNCLIVDVMPLYSTKLSQNWLQISSYSVVPQTRVLQSTHGLLVEEVILGKLYIAKLIEDIHVEFLVTSKLRASTTDSGSNFCKCFRERGATSNFSDDDEDFSDSESDDDDMIFIDLGEILGHVDDCPFDKCPPDFAPIAPRLEEQFMKEYVIVMQSVVDGLNILQGDKNVGLGYLLPTLSVLKTNLRLLQDDPSIVHCQPLITSLLTSINIRFYDIFQDKECWLAAISNPVFKLLWLDDEDEFKKARAYISSAFERNRDQLDDNSKTSDEDTDETASSKSDLSPAKRRKLNINFFAKLKKKNSQNNTFDELDSYFKHCKNLEDLKNYPTVQKNYKRFNVPLPSSASVERLFSQGGLIYVPKRTNLTDRHFEMLLFLKVNDPAFTVWSS